MLNNVEMYDIWNDEFVKLKKQKTNETNTRV